jgi:autotransporter-associated beta strand protein
VELLDVRLAPATFTWVGGTNNLWSVAANWQGQVTPQGAVNADIVFPPMCNTLSRDDIPGTVSIHSIAFQRSGVSLDANPGSTLGLGAGTVTMTTSGTDQITAPLALGPTGLFTGHYFQVPAGATLTLTGHLGDTGLDALVKNGPGQLQIAAAQDARTGSTDVAAGTLAILSGNPSGTTAMEVDPGATLDLHSMSGGSVYGVGSLSGNGGQVVLGSAYLQIAPGQGGTFAGVLSGAGGISKVGTGTQTFTGNNTYTGLTHVNGGTLVVNGAQPGSPVFVSAGATLSGRGAVGAVDVFGTVSPGDTNLGTLHAASASFHSGSRFRVRIRVNPGISYDALAAGSGINLSGSPTLQASLLTGFVGVPAYLILQGTVTGTFANLPNGASFPIPDPYNNQYQFQIFYGPWFGHPGAYLWPPVQFVIMHQIPPNLLAGSNAPVHFTVLDSTGQPATSFHDTIHFASTDPQATLPPDYTFTEADRGEHDFTLTLRTAGSQTVTVTDTANPSFATSAAASVSPADAVRFQVTGFPSPVQAGMTGSVTVTAFDPYGNVATGYRGVASLSSSDGQAALDPAYAFTAADSGSRAFGAILRTAGTQSLTATDTSDDTVTGTQDGIVVAPASATALVVTAPATVSTGIPFNVTVTAVDPFGNTDTNYQGTVTFSTSDPDPGVILPADYTFTLDDGGVHTLTDTGLGETTLVTPGAQTITASDTSDNTITGNALVAVGSPGPAPGGRPHGQAWRAGQPAAFADQVLMDWLRARSRNQERGQPQPWGTDWLDGADAVLI